MNHMFSIAHGTYSISGKKLIGTAGALSLNIDLIGRNPKDNRVAGEGSTEHENGKGWVRPEIQAIELSAEELARIDASSDPEATLAASTKVDASPHLNDPP